LTNGIIGKKFPDHPDFEPVLARAEALGVPIYIHPGLLPRILESDRAILESVAEY
jgi:uncharacterized protein